MRYYKVLHDGKSCHGGSLDWSLPIKNEDGSWTPGEWMPKIKGKLVPCVKGYHVCEFKDLVSWLEKDIYECEVKGRVIRDDDKSVVREIRLTRKVEAWNGRSARLFACDCAERVLPIFEKDYPGDLRPRAAIQTARDFADGKATEQQRAAAWAAAGAAAWAAAWAAAGATASAAAWAAAWAAAGATASAAACAAAAAAACAAAWAAACAAAWAAERSWQIQKLTEYIGG